MGGRTSIEVDPELKAIMAGAVEGAENGTGALRGTFRVDVELLDGVATEARVRGFRLVVDEPPSFGGTDAGGNPEEGLLAGVGTCQAITGGLYAAYLGIPIRRYSVRLTGDADFTGFHGLSDGPKGFDRVRCGVTIEAGTPEEQLRELERMVENRCVGTLRHPVAVEATWKITGVDSAEAAP